MALLVIVLLIALLVWQPPLVLFLGFVAYAASGYVVSGWRWWRGRHFRAPPQS
jgi:hypothetical protein